VYLRLGRQGVPTIFEAGTQFEIGKIRVVTPGKDIVVFATGPLVASAMLAAKQLEKQQLSIKVINVSCIAPLDIEGVLRELAGAKLVITAEDHSVNNGLGSAIAEVMAEHAIGARLFRHGMRRFGESGNSDDLYVKYKFDAAGVAEIVNSVSNKPL